MSSGGPGYVLPAAVALALAEPGLTVIDPRVDPSFGVLYTARR